MAKQIDLGEIERSQHVVQVLGEAREAVAVIGLVGVSVAALVQR
jgi:hypothetical protein